MLAYYDFDEETLGLLHKYLQNMEFQATLYEHRAIAD